MLSARLLTALCLAAFPAAAMAEDALTSVTTADTPLAAPPTEWLGPTPHFVMMGSAGGTVTPAGAGSAAAAAPAQQTFRVEIHNDGTPQEVTSAVPTFDATGTVVQIFTRDLQRNGPMAQALTAFKGRR